jgi:hypothetical protein
MYWTQLANNIITLEAFLKHDNKPSGSIKIREFPGQLNDYQFLKNSLQLLNLKQF